MHVFILFQLTTAVLGWVKLVLDVTWAWIALSVIRAVYNPPGSYWVVVNRIMQAMFTASALLLVEKPTFSHNGSCPFVGQLTNEYSWCTTLHMTLGLFLGRR